MASKNKLIGPVESLGAPGQQLVFFLAPKGLNRHLQSICRSREGGGEGGLKGGRHVRHIIPKDSCEEDRIYSCIIFSSTKMLLARGLV